MPHKFYALFFEKHFSVFFLSFSSSGHWTKLKLAVAITLCLYTHSYMAKKWLLLEVVMLYHSPVYFDQTLSHVENILLINLANPEIWHLTATFWFKEQMHHSIQLLHTIWKYIYKTFDVRFVAYRCLSHTKTWMHSKTFTTHSSWVASVSVSFHLHMKHTIFPKS